MKCPVCKKELDNNAAQCTVCGFSDLCHDFLNVDDAISWMEQVVTPYKERWEASHSRVSAYDLYQTMMREQVQQLGETSALKADFEYEINENGAVLTKYHGNESVVKIPEQIDGYTVYKLGDELFSCYENVIEVVIPKTCKSLGQFVFSESSIEAIVFPEKITEIPWGTCNMCKKLETVVFQGNKLDFIDKFAFCGCDKLKHIRLPEEIRQIRAAAFNADTALESVLLPKKLGELDGQSFGLVPTAFVFRDDYTSFVGVFLFSGNAVFYCNNGSSAHRQAIRHNIPHKPLNEFLIN